MTKDEILSAWTVLHFSNMDKLLTSLRDVGVKLTPISPAPNYDMDNTCFIYVCPIKRLLACMGGNKFSKLDWQGQIFRRYPINLVMSSPLAPVDKKIDILSHYSRCCTVLADEVHKLCRVNKSLSQSDSNVVSLV